MITIMKNAIRGVFRRLGYDIVNRSQPLPNLEAGLHPDIDESTAMLCDYVKPFTLTNKERIYALRKSVEYIIKHNIEGAIVECGVWKGGSMMVVARTLIECGAKRELWLFDTFEGMSDPTSVDNDFTGRSAAELMEGYRKSTNQTMATCSLDEVKRNLQLTGYDEDQILYIKGKVEDTVPAHAPDRIALLRLDTDWYESTYHELVHLYPRISVGGVLLIDDYGHFTGCRKAVDQYIDENHLRILLDRLDYTARICVKQQS
jgi:O-methyltransferase